MLANPRACAWVQQLFIHLPDPDILATSQRRFLFCLQCGLNKSSRADKLNRSFKGL